MGIQVIGDNKIINKEGKMKKAGILIITAVFLLLASTNGFAETAPEDVKQWKNEFKVIVYTANNYGIVVSAVITSDVEGVNGQGQDYTQAITTFLELLGSTLKDTDTVGTIHTFNIDGYDVTTTIDSKKSYDGNNVLSGKIGESHTQGVTASGDNIKTDTVDTYEVREGEALRISSDSETIITKGGQEKSRSTSHTDTTYERYGGIYLEARSVTVSTDTMANGDWTTSTAIREITRDGVGNITGKTGSIAHTGRVTGGDGQQYNTSGTTTETYTQAENGRWYLSKSEYVSNEK